MKIVILAAVAAITLVAGAAVAFGTCGDCDTCCATQQACSMPCCK